MRGREIALMIPNVKAHLFVGTRIVQINQFDTAAQGLAAKTLIVWIKNAIQIRINVVWIPLVTYGLSVQMISHAIIFRGTVITIQNVKAR